LRRWIPAGFLRGKPLRLLRKKFSGYPPNPDTRLPTKEGVQLAVRKSGGSLFAR